LTSVQSARVVVLQHLHTICWLPGRLPKWALTYCNASRVFPSLTSSTHSWIRTLTISHYIKKGCLLFWGGFDGIFEYFSARCLFEGVSRGFSARCFFEGVSTEFLFVYDFCVINLYIFIIHAWPLFLFIACSFCIIRTLTISHYWKWVSPFLREFRGDFMLSIFEWFIFI
jgi:hypothetical protein